MKLGQYLILQRSTGCISIITATLFSLAVAQNVYAFDSCEEFCPAQDESGYGTFKDVSEDTVTCCCLPDSEGSPMTSKPLPQCQMP